MFKFLGKKERKTEETKSVPSVEAVAALQRASKAVKEADSDLSAIRVHSARSKMERHANHFAPAILAALESSRREE